MSISVNTSETISENMSADKEFFRNIGYSVFGPALLGFASRIGQKMTELKTAQPGGGNAQSGGNSGLSNENAKLFFLARDGEIVMRACEILGKKYPALRGGSYLYVSRKALYVPLLRNADTYEKALEAINPHPSYTAVQFVESLGLDAGDCPADADLSRAIMREQLKDDKEFRRIFEAVKPKMIENSREQAQLLSEYFRQEGFISAADTDSAQKNGQKNIIVDIGWNATIQKFLQAFLNSVECSDVPPCSDVSIFGMYFGLTQKATFLSENGEGYWFDLKGRKPGRAPEAPFRGLPELIFSSAEGSANGYRRENGRVKPILLPYEYAENRVQCDNLAVLREAALKYVADNAGLSDGKPDANSITDSAQAVKPLVRLGMRPTLKEARILGDLDFENGDIYPLARPKSVGFYAKHPKEFKADFMASQWKVAFLKRLFKIPMRYDLVYSILDKIKKD